MWKTYFWFLKWVTVIANYSSTPLTMNLIEVTNKFFSSTKLMLQNKYSNTSNGFAHATNCETVNSASSYSYNRQQNELRHFVLKELFDVFLTSREEKIAPCPPSPPYNVVPLFELPLENNKHSNFEWRGQGWGVDSFVLWRYPIWIQCLNNFLSNCRFLSHDKFWVLSPVLHPYLLFCSAGREKSLTTTLK